VYVKGKEPTTMTYYFGIPLDYEKNPSGTTSMLAFEVYGKREVGLSRYLQALATDSDLIAVQDLYETHFNSPAMSVFLKKIPSTMPTGLDLNHYEKVGGFLDKPGDMRECAIMQDIRISCVSATAREAVKSKAARLCKAIEEAEGEEGNGVYTWMTFSSLDNDTEVRIWSRYATREAMEKVARRKDVLDFWFDTKEDVDKMMATRWAPNGKGWLHR
jgi:quinol monooxygenase YgiN